MKFYHKEIIHDILIGMAMAVLMVCMIFGAALQEQDKLSAMGAVEVYG